MVGKDPINVMFQQQMGMVVLNPTNEDFDMQFSGVSFSLKAGQKMVLAEHAAKHVLNAFGQRGLTYLAFGADEEALAADGKRRNKEFKIKQLTEFNIRNESRKNMNMGYLPPTQKLKEYALELGIELMQPYATRDLERTKMNAQDDEITALRRANSDLTEKVNKLIELMTGDKKAEPAPSPVQEQGPPVAAANAEKPFVCDHPGCGAAFTTNIALVGHMRSHKET